MAGPVVGAEVVRAERGRRTAIIVPHSGSSSELSRMISTTWSLRIASVAASPRRGCGPGSTGRPSPSGSSFTEPVDKPPTGCRSRSAGSSCRCRSARPRPPSGAAASGSGRPCRCRRRRARAARSPGRTRDCRSRRTRWTRRPARAAGPSRRCGCRPPPALCPRGSSWAPDSRATASLA